MRRFYYPSCLESLSFNQSIHCATCASQELAFHAINWLHSTIPVGDSAKLSQARNAFVSDTDEATGEATCDVSGKSMLHYHVEGRLDWLSQLPLHLAQSLMGTLPVFRRLEGLLIFGAVFTHPAARKQSKSDPRPWKTTIIGSLWPTKTLFVPQFYGLDALDTRVSFLGQSKLTHNLDRIGSKKSPNSSYDEFSDILYIKSFSEPKVDDCPSNWMRSGRPVIS